MIRLRRVRDEYEALAVFKQYGSFVLKPCKFRKGWIAYVTRSAVAS